MTIDRDRHRDRPGLLDRDRPARAATTEWTSLTSSESDADTSTETDIDTATEADTSSLTMGAAGVVLSGSTYEYDDDIRHVSPRTTPTPARRPARKQDTSTEDVGGNTTSDSDSTSETDTDSSTDSDAGTD